MLVPPFRRELGVDARRVDCGWVAMHAGSTVHVNESGIGALRDCVFCS